MKAIFSQLQNTVISFQLRQFELQQFHFIHTAFGHIDHGNFFHFEVYRNYGFETSCRSRHSYLNFPPRLIKANLEIIVILKAAQYSVVVLSQICLPINFKDFLL